MCIFKFKIKKNESEDHNDYLDTFKRQKKYFLCLIFGDLLNSCRLTLHNIAIIELRIIFSYTLMTIFSIFCYIKKLNYTSIEYNNKLHFVYLMISSLCRVSWQKKFIRKRICFFFGT
jgi:hypothetical protein